ncbi:hypothetical protein C1I97_25820 [Streptomyces sp. NTH33]|uniref:hypothetical protein n=1 Tax=Streptomyces sp. NTH33 TaxID=1735453 RepID=UPI000DA713C2|nr:hypothetical protein [Streptomyces sp. NTH33]PZG96826.1 hypothetical protein C1I97_25820 [Streptomyces sp. NTH33]
MSEKDEERDAHEPHARQEPARHHEEHEHTQSHSGNGTVNNSPDEPGLDGFDSDELELRRMLHQAVQDVEPRDGALEHLRRAVPARRARKRQAAVGMAAAALFVCTAVPALVHVSQSTGSDANPAIAGQASEAHGGTGRGKSPDGGESSIDNPSGKAADKGGSGGGEGRKDGTGTVGSGPVGDAGSPSAGSGSGTPTCTASQLGSANATVEAPDSAGVVHGTFHIVNVSSENCSVGGPGRVGHLAQGAADDTMISVVNHVPGDAAAGLPDPSTEAPGLLLAPGAAYEVKFAWVPSQTCPVNDGGSSGGETEGPSPDPTPTQSTSATGTTGATTTEGDSGHTPQTLRADGPADGSVVVSYTAEAGSPAVSATVSNACAGTVYRTGVLPAP